MVGGVEDEHAAVDDPTRVDASATPSARLARAALAQPRVNLVDWLKDQVQNSFGAKLGRYALLRVLGEGGMGVVFAAYDEDLDRKVAIKLLRTPATGAGWDESWLRNEAKAMARLSHPNIVQVYDVAQEEGALFVAMEFVVGVSLREWFRAEKRSVREAVEMCAQAGRGLQAAHEAGLVHCDFKPQNVLVGKDGRVRVLDFGLAQLRERTQAPHAAAAPDESQRTTLIGGTPAYMAPELYLQGVPDARSDQFAFCVTLYEALYGKRPFSGKGYEELGRAICRGEVDPPPSEARVPTWLRRIILRGISTDPKERWPSMEALLAALGRDPARSARRVLLAAGGAALTALLVVNVAQRRALEAELEAHRCDAAAGPAEAWDAAHREAVRKAILGSGVHFAEDTWPRVEGRLDEYTAAWSAMRIEACESHRSGVQSDLLYERRVACLEQRQGDLAALVAVYSAADRDVVTKAVKASFELRPLAPCADAEVLLAEVAPPETPELAAEVGRLRKELAPVRAEMSAGRVKRAKQRLNELAPAIAATAYRPLIAEAQYLVGMVEETLGDFKPAVAAFERSLWAAEASRYDQVAAEAAIRLTMVVGYRQAKLEESALWERLTTSVLERRGGARDLESRWLSALGVVRMRDGRLDEAAAMMAQALAAAEKSAGPRSFEVALLLGNLGSIAGIRGDNVAAGEFSRRALSALESLLGGDHPDVASICANNGAAALGRADFAAARAFLERARGIYERSVGEDHPDVARVYNNLGSIYSRLDEYDKALDLQTRGLEMRRRLLGDEHTDTANSEANIADSYLHIGEPAKALEHIERALAGHQASVGDKHVRYGATLTLRGQALLALKRTQAAIADFERALAILTASGTAPREHLGEPRLGLARALWSNQRERARALALAREAVQNFKAAGPAYAKELVEAESWLAERGR